MARKVSKNPLHTKFYSTISASRRFKAEEGEGAEEAPGYMGPEEEGGRTRGSTRRKGRPSEHEQVNINMVDAHQLVHTNPDRAIRDLAYYKTRSQRFVPREVTGPAAAEIDAEFTRPRVTQTDKTMIARREREQAWNTHANVYRVTPKDRKAPGSFISQEAAPSHRAWIEQQMRDPNSEFNRGLEQETRSKTGRYTPGQRRRLARYTDSLQRGATHQEALSSVRSTRLKEGVGRPSVAERRTSEARRVVKGPGPQGRATKYQSVAPSQREFKFGIDAPHKPTMDAIRDMYSNASKQERVQIQQAGTELVSQELLANQKWAHETRRANLLGQKSGQGAREDPDKVTIFTTNVGHPTVSVPSDSLVGQYIIRKRKSVLGGYNVPSSQLRGKFPEAVRDAHIVDVATGASVGVQGRQGVFNNTGYRFGKRASAGYGRPRPLGSHILYDRSSGRPLYDSQGNIRYSEGATRPVDYTTPNVGFRVLIG